MTYTGTLTDYDLLIDGGYLDPTDEFDVVSADEVRISFAALINKARYDEFWRGWKLATAEAAAAVKAVQRPSLMQRIAGWLA